MTKYKLEDLKVGAVFKSTCTTRTILMVGKKEVFYYYVNDSGTYWESSAAFDSFLGGHCGDLVRPTKKIAYVEYQSKHDLMSKIYCPKKVWDMVKNDSNLKLIREFEIEVGEDGFPVEETL